MNKILIIDDDRELCALIKCSVQAENIEADFCNTGKEGLQKLREQEYQLVVLDVMMPGMDGFETLEEIRKENSLPILMFTSKNDSISKVRGLRAGADDYLTKPFDMDELIARIASLIRRLPFPFFTSTSTSVISAICFFTRRTRTMEVNTATTAITMDKKTMISILAIPPY